MKSSFFAKSMAFLSVLTVVSGHAFTPVPGTRLWDLVAEYDTIACTAESELEALANTLTADFAGTFTVINSILQKACTTESLLDLTNSKVLIINDDANAISSKLNIINSDVEELSSLVAVINNDFSGIYTLIDGITQTTSSKLDVALNEISLIDSSLSALEYIQNVDFVAISTTIDVVGSSIDQALSKVEHLNLQVGSQLEGIESKLVVAKNDIITIDSQIDVIDNEAIAGFNGTFTVIDEITQKLCTAESKLENIVIVVSVDFAPVYTEIAFIQSKADVIDSKLTMLAVPVESLESKVISINSKTTIIDQKACAIASDVEILASQLGVIDNFAGNISSQVTVVDSKVDELNMLLMTVDSTLSVIDSKVINLAGQVSVQDSLIGAIEQNVLTIDSKVNQLDSSINIIDEKTMSVLSKTDLLGSELDGIKNKIVPINSSLFVIDSKISGLGATLTSIESKVDIIGNNVGDINSKVSVAVQEAFTIDSKVSVVGSLTDATTTVINVIASEVDGVSSKLNQLNSGIDHALTTAISIESKMLTVGSLVDVALTSVTSLDSKLDVLESDFQQTWTILAAIDTKASVIQSMSTVIDSKVMALAIAADFSGIFTALNQASMTIMTVDSKVDVINSKLAVAAATSLTGVYTVIATIQTKANSTSSTLDIIDSNVDIIQNCYGIPIYQVNLPLTISASGKYYVAEQLSASTVDAITINANDVTIEFLGRTLTGGGTTNKAGIVINDQKRGIAIQNGTIRNTSGPAIQAKPNCQNVFITNMSIISTSTNGIQFDPGGSEIILDDCRVSGCVRNGVSLKRCTDILVQESIFNNNGSAIDSHGLYIADGTRVNVIDCIANNNIETGFTFTAVIGATITQHQILECKAFQNVSNGIFLINATDSVVQGCISRDNALAGIRLHGGLNVDVSENISSGNTGQGIVLGFGGRKTSNCYIADNTMLLNNSAAATSKINLIEEVDNGPNSILGNFALGEDSRVDYITNVTFVNRVGLAQAAAFSGTSFPTRWHNIAGQT